MCEAQERRRLLFESFTPVKSKFAFANSKVCLFVYVCVHICEQCVATAAVVESAFV